MYLAAWTALERKGSCEDGMSLEISGQGRKHEGT